MNYLALRSTLRQMAEDAIDRDEDGRDAQIRARPEWRAATALAALVTECAELRKKLGGADAAVEADTLPEG